MNFLFHEHGIVFIHIPKSAGTSIRAAFGNCVTGPVSGKIPQEWKIFPSFTVVRHPVERFLSALNMFKVGATGIDAKDYYRQARLPNLTVPQALDILEDPAIGFDRSARDPIRNLKHHMWPQTHVFNCLHLAQKVMHYEMLDKDFRSFCNQHCLDLVLPKLRRTSITPNALTVDDITSQDMDRITHFFRDDFEKLGYDPEYLGDVRRWPRSSAAQPILQDPRLVTAWPAYFCNDMPVTGSALPAPDADLKCFAQISIPGSAGTGWAGREKSILKHFRALEPEFSGTPWLCHLLACTIVVLRRNPNDADARRLFCRIVREHGEIACDLNSRWLTSVCDTLVDVADNELDRVLGMTGTLFSNSMKLVETQFRLFYPRRPWPPKKRLSRGGKLYDGMITFWLEKGDMIENLLDRVESVLSIEADGAPFVREIINRIIENDTTLSRIMALSGQKNLPVVNMEKLEHIKKLMVDL